MPAVNPNNASQGGPGPQRTTFRPPWVKDGPTPLPLPTAPWTARGREAVAAASGTSTAADEAKVGDKPAPRKLSRVTIIPSQPSDNSSQEVFSQANLKWSPKAPEKNQQSPVLPSNPQPQITPEENQNSSEPLSIRQLQTQRNTVKDVGLVFTQGNSKSATKCDEKKQDLPVQQAPHEKSEILSNIKDLSINQAPSQKSELTSNKKQDLPVQRAPHEKSEILSNIKKQDLPVQQAPHEKSEILSNIKKQDLPVQQAPHEKSEILSNIKKQDLPVQQAPHEKSEILSNIKKQNLPVQQAPHEKSEILSNIKDLSINLAPSQKSELTSNKKQNFPTEKAANQRSESILNKKQNFPTEKAANRSFESILNKDLSVEHAHIQKSEVISSKKQDSPTQQTPNQRSDVISNKDVGLVYSNAKANLKPTAKPKNKKDDIPTRTKHTTNDGSEVVLNKDVGHLYNRENLKPTSKDSIEDSSSPSSNANRPSEATQEGQGQSQPGARRKESTTTIPVVVESKRRESTAAAATEVPRKKESVVTIKREPEKEPPKASREFAKPVPKPVEKELPKSILKDPSKSSIPAAPKPPPAPPMAPPLPPPPPGKGTTPVIESEMTVAKAAKLEALRSRPRRRPDWTDMMKEVESGRKLNHVVCNDRSAPILPQANVKGQFVYESEKEVGQAPHKQLLTQIQSGVKLKKVKCNDRSKPNLDGLRKFRRQMTIEEQIQKSMSMADVVAVAAEPDELDDIDKVRDDLQSTKQMLAQELRNKEALERENKRLMARLLNLEVELEKEKNTKRIDGEKGTVMQARSSADEKLVQQLKEEATDANRVAKEMEDKYHVTAEELDATRAKLESAWLRNQQLELELKTKGTGSSVPISKQMSSKKLAAAASMPNGKSGPVSDDESEYTEETETETESEDEGNEADAAAVQERRVARELKLLATKLRSYKDKQAAALKERHSLREQLRKQQKQLRQEKKKYKALQKEVDKMAKLMKDDEDDEEEEEEKPEEGETEEETESESESEESEEDDPTDGDLPEDASVEDKRKNLMDRSKHHENRLGTLKKGNYLLKANIDRLQDDINRQREMSLSLQEDLNSVLAELG